MSTVPKNPKQINSSISVNCVLFGYTNEKLVVLLVNPIDSSSHLKDQKYLLPEALASDVECLNESANRILVEKADIKDISLKQLHTFGNPNRLKENIDENWKNENGTSYGNRVIAVSYFSLINLENKAYSTSDNVNWHSVDKLPNLVLDHEEIIQYALQHLRSSFLNIQGDYSYLLPKKFTLSALQNLYEVILGKKMDKRNFRKVIHNKPFLKQLKSIEKGLAHRPARLYSYKKITL